MEFLIAGLFITAFIAAVILGIYSIWKTYSLAGEPGWAVLIPGYREYIMGKISKRNRYFVIVFVILGIVSFVLNNMSFLTNNNPNIDVISLIIFILLLSINIYVVVGMSKRYSGVSPSFWVFFIILPFLCAIKLKYLKFKK